MIRSSGAELGLGAGEVVGGEQEDRDDLDAGLVAPAQQVDDLGRAAAVAVVDVLEPAGPGPAPVAVDDHADVARQLGPLQRAGQPAFVDHGEHIADLLARPHAATLGPAADRPGPARPRRQRVLPASHRALRMPRNLRVRNLGA